jgi:SAM-dependent methyltransferase
MLTQEDWHRRYQQQAVWTAGIRRYLYELIQIKTARRVLEVGCGTGAITSDLHAFTPARVFGVDLRLDALRLAGTVDPASAFTAADGLFLPFADHSFDVTLCHFFLLWVKDAGRAAAEMARVTRPGGYLLFLAEPDYGGRIDYPDPLTRLGQMQAEALRKQGADPEMGRKLAALLSEAGLKDAEVGVLGGQWKAGLDDAEWRAEWSVLKSDLGGMTSKEELNWLREFDRQARQRGERVLFVPTFHAWGQVEK